MAPVLLGFITYVSKNLLPLWRATIFIEILNGKFTASLPPPPGKHVKLLFLIFKLLLCKSKEQNKNMGTYLKKLEKKLQKWDKNFRNFFHASFVPIFPGRTQDKKSLNLFRTIF